MKQTIQSKLTGYSILLILLTTISVITGAIVLQMYQTSQDNENRLLRATEIFHKDFEAHIQSIYSDWHVFTSDADRTNQFMLPLMFAPYITYIPKQLHNLGKQYDAIEIALYLPGDAEQINRLYAYYDKQDAAVVLLSDNHSTKENLIFQWDKEGNLRQKSTTVDPGFSEIYREQPVDSVLEIREQQLTLVSHLQYINTTFEDFSMGITNGSHIGYLVLRTPMRDFIKNMEYRLGISFSVFDIDKKGGLNSVRFQSLPGQNTQTPGQVFATIDKDNNHHDVIVSPIKNGEAVIGYLVASISQEEFYQRIKATIAILLLIALMVVLVSFLFSWRYVKMISTPLRRLSHSFESYQTRDRLSAKPVTKSIEIIQANSSFLQVSEFKNLINSVKRMLGFIEQQTATIESQNLSLEEQIDVIEQKNLELEEINKLKDEFLASTSHELRTPLHGIIGLAEVMLAADGIVRSEEEKRQLSMIIANGRRLNNLLSDLLDFYRMKNHSIQLNKVPVNLHAVTEALLTFSRPIIGEKPIELINEIPTNLPAVEADKNKLEQVFFNLLSNSVKFTKKGTIKVKAEQAEDAIRIMVEDSGIGIPADKIDTIFELFTQLDGSITREQPGTGLGLSITKKLVEQHGSELYVESEPEKGTAFYFDLPIFPDALACDTLQDTTNGNLTVFGQRFIETAPVDKDELLSKNTPVGLSRKQTILVVDDDPVNLEILKTALVGFGYHVNLAGDGLEALQLLETTLPDLILLDLMMPYMSGFELCEKIRTKWDIITLPIIILTAKNQLKDLEKGFQAGANDYLTKPFHPREILARVQTQLMAREAIKHLQENERLLEEISRRKQLEHDLLKSQKQLIRILNIEEDAIICINSSNTILFFNQGAEQFFGVPSASITGTPVTRLFPLLDFQHGDEFSGNHEENKHTLVEAKVKNSTQIQVISHISRFVVDDEILTTIILPKQDLKAEQTDFYRERHTGLSPENRNNSDINRKLAEMGSDLETHHYKIRTLEKALGEVITAISSSGATTKIASVPLNDTSPFLTQETHPKDKIRNLILDVMSVSLELWEKTTGKSKIDLAQESGIWSVQLDNGTFKTRTLDKYLKFKSIPGKPRMKSIISTAGFVMEQCSLTPSQRHSLLSSVNKLKELVR